MAINDSLMNLEEIADARRRADGGQILWRLVEQRLSLERGSVERIFQEVSGSISDPLETAWWQIFSEASVALGLRPSVVDCSLDQATQLAVHGADLVLFGGHTGPGWAIMQTQRRGRVLIWRPVDSEQTLLSRQQAVRQYLSQFVEDGRIRCIAYDWHEASLIDARATAPASPLARLKQVLQPEMTDVWLVVLFAFVVGLLALATPIAVESLVNTVAFGRYLQPIVVLAAILFGFLAFSAAVTALQTYVVEIIQQRLFARVAADLSNRLPRVAGAAIDGVYMPELVNRFFDVVTVQKVSAKLLLDGVSLILTVAIGMIVLGFYHPFLLGFDLVLLASIGFLIVVLGRGAVGTAIKESKTKYSLAAWLQDVARCETTFRSAAGKRLSAGRADRLISGYLGARRSHFRILFRQVIFALALYALASTVLLGLGGWLVVSGELTLGQLVAAELIVAVIVGAFAKIGKHLENYYDLLAAVEKLGVLFDVPTERQGGMLVASGNEAVTVEVDAATCKRAGRPVFSAVTLSLDAGNSLALWGPAGAGKSTLMELLYGIRRADSGRILVNGRQPTDLQTDDYRAHVELVREGEIFAGTIAENIHLQRPEISSDEVRESLQAVGLLDTINQTEAGLETRLSSHGKPLSQNQGRLLLLARAVAAAPSLLLVDGVLDGLADEELEDTLDVLLNPENNWTVVIATGRRQVAERCERTLLLPTAQFMSSSQRTSR